MTDEKKWSLLYIAKEKPFTKEEDGKDLTPEDAVRELHEFIRYGRERWQDKYHGALIMSEEGETLINLSFPVDEEADAKPCPDGRYVPEWARLDKKEKAAKWKAEQDQQVADDEAEEYNRAMRMEYDDF